MAGIKSSRRVIATRAALSVTIFVVGLALWLCRASRPSLEWYVSPPFGATGKRIRILKPVGWEKVDLTPANANIFPNWTLIVLRPPDRRPELLKWLLPPPDRDEALWLYGAQPIDPRGYDGRMDVFRDGGCRLPNISSYRATFWLKYS